MRSFVLSLVAMLAFAGAGAAQTTHPAGSKLPEVLRGASAEQTTKKQPAAKAVVQKASVARSAQRPAAAKHTTPQSLRGSRYGGFAPAAPLPPPVLDTTSPRSLALVNVNSGETLAVTYWSEGAYHRDALDKLNHFLRDTRDNAQTEMDPLLFDVLWHTTKIVGYGGSGEVSWPSGPPTTTAGWASATRGVASDTHHINGNPMNTRSRGVPVF